MFVVFSAILIFYFFIGPSANRTPEAVTQSVHNYIKKLPVQSSHHSRAHTPNRFYMDSDVSSTKLFMSYVDWMVDNHPGEIVAKEWLFKDIFRKQYNITPR